MNALFTIGYQGSSAEAFVEALVNARVDGLVDVREAPWSRRPEFTRRALDQRLAAAGIGYRHERTLGAPQALRDRLRAGGDRAEFESGYLAHLAGQEEALAGLAREVPGRAALMCCEAEPSECHRRLVAEALRRLTGLAPRHLHPGRDRYDRAQGRLDLD